MPLFLFLYGTKHFSNSIVNWAFFSKVTFQPLTQATPRSSVALSYLLAKANLLQITVHLVAFFNGGHKRNQIPVPSPNPFQWNR